MSFFYSQYNYNVYIINYPIFRHAGRPNVAATASQMKNMFELGFTVSQMASHYHISRPTVYKLLTESGVEYSARYKTLSGAQLDAKITEIKRTHPNVGEVNVMGHLRAMNIQVQGSVICPTKCNLWEFKCVINGLSA